MFRFNAGCLSTQGQQRLNQALLAVAAVPLPRFPGSLAALFARPGAPVYEIFPVLEGGSAGLRGWRLIWLAASVGFSQECDSWSDLLVQRSSDPGGRV